MKIVWNLCDGLVGDFFGGGIVFVGGGFGVEDLGVVIVEVYWCVFVEWDVDVGGEIDLVVWIDLIDLDWWDFGVDVFGYV